MMSKRGNKKTRGSQRWNNMLVRRIGDFTENDLMEFQQIFEYFDQDGKRTIELSDLKVALCALGYNPTDEEVELITEAMIIGDDASIDFGEFCMIIEFLCDLKDQVGLLRDAFRCMDSNNDGSVQAEELLDLLLGKDMDMSLKEAHELIRFADKNGDGRIVYNDFIEFLVNVPADLSPAYNSPSASSIDASQHQRTKFTFSKKARQNWQNLKINRKFLTDKLKYFRLVKRKDSTFDETNTSQWQSTSIGNEPNLFISNRHALDDGLERTVLPGNDEKEES